MAEKDKKQRVGPIRFLRQVRAEADKITWATLQETRQAAIFVLIMSVLFAIFLFSADTLIKFLFTAGGIIARP